MPVTNEEIAQVFENLAALLEMKGESVFKIRAYQRAARTIEGLPFSLEQAVREGRDLTEIPGIGEAIAKKIVEFVTTGKMSAYEKVRAEFPEGVLELLQVPGIGPKTALRLVRELNITSVDELERAILEGKLEGLPRMGERTVQSILRHIRSLRSQGKRTPLGRALYVAESVISALRESCPGIGAIGPAGSLRRWKETVGDIDIMGTADDPSRAVEALARLPIVRDVLARGPKKASVVVDPGVQVDVRFVPRENYGTLIQYFTGSKQHNILLRDYANRLGLSISEYGITDLKTERVETFAEEPAVYERLGLQYIPPEIREGTWEVDLAREGRIPRLVEVSDIRGDLHVHTDWSDGRDPIEAMVEEAVRRGYEYVAITDHSAGRAVANGLSVDRMRRQMQVIRALNERYPIRVFTGSEVDIRADGSLDYPDDLLEELEVVVAAVHSALEQERSRITERVIRAMRHPRVTVLAHPTGRLLGEREPSDLDMEAVFRTALETGTVLEINASPERLDLRDVHVMRARELGVPLVISTDAHRTETLGQMRFGVAVARRGWCEARHIINTWPLEWMEEFIRAPKERRLEIFRRRLGSL